MAEKIIPKIEATNCVIEFATRAYAKFDKSHDYSHGVKVYSNALRIMEKEQFKCNTSQEQLEFYVVMLCHDVLDHKLLAKGLCLPPEEITAFYTDLLGPEAAARIVHIHANCSWSKRKESIPATHNDWMRLVLQDADWIEALDLQRCIEYNTVYNPGATPAEIARDVCNHINEKLLHIPGELNFDSSRLLVAVEGRLNPLYDYLTANNVRPIIFDQ